MNNRMIITISRQFGSGGYQIGELLSTKLDLPLFDKNAIAQAMKEYGIYTRIMNEERSSPTNSLLFSIAANMYPLGRHGLSFEQQIGLAEEETMRNLAKEGSCIFIGRAADAVFADNPGRISFFIHAPLDWRTARVAQQYHLPDARAKSLTQQMDKKRASYYMERTDGNWAEAQTYHLSIDSSLLTTEETVQQLCAFIRAVHNR